MNDETTRILGMVEGEPASTLSGIAHHLFEALDRRFAIVERLDYAPHGARRIALAAATFRPSRPAWRARFHTSRLAHRRLSATLKRRLAAVDREFDLAFQVFGWVQGQPRPYALYVDQTRLMAERGWPEWMPLVRSERSALLALERTMYEQAVHVFTMGKPGRESLLTDYGVEPSQVTAVGGGLNFDTVPRPAGPAADPTILFVGKDFERKGGDVLLRAFELVRSELPDAVLNIAGVSRRFDLPGVVTHGRISSRRQLEELYRDARAFCLPSHYEPYGLVLVEAMAHAVPCVGTAVQSIPEILDEGRAGLLVPPGAPEALADVMLRLLTDDRLARTIGAAGRQRMEQSLTWDRVVDRMAPTILGIRAGVV